jgi:hypothetical protein
MEIWNQIRCHKVSLLTAPHFQVRGVGQDMKQTYLYLWYPLFQAQWDRCYKLEHVDEAKQKYMCVYYHMSKKSRVGRSALIFFFFFFYNYRQNRK